MSRMTRQQLQNIEAAASACAQAALDVNRVAQDLATAAHNGATTAATAALFQSYQRAVEAANRSQERLEERFQEVGIDASGTEPV